MVKKTEFHYYQMLFFRIAICLFLTHRFVENVVFSSEYETIGIVIYKYLRYIWLVILVIALGFTVADLQKSFIVYMIAILLLVVSWKVSHDMALVWSGLFIAAATNLEADILLKDYLKVRIVLLILLFGGLSSGIVSINRMVQADGIRIRYGLGMTHPNTFGCIILVTFLLVWVFYLQNHFFITLGICILHLIIFGIFIDSRTIALLFGIFPTIVIAEKVIERKNKKLMDFAVLIPVLLTCFSIIIVYLCRNITPEHVSAFWKNYFQRFHMPYYYFKNYGIGLFGKNLDISYGIQTRSAGYETAALDLTYLRVPLYYGIIAMVIVLIALSYLIWKLLKKERYDYLIVCGIIFLHMIMENNMLRIQYNPFLLLISANIVGKKNLKGYIGTI